MTLDSSRLLSANELSRLTEGSYEQLVSKVWDYLSEVSEEIFGGASIKDILATKLDHAVVVSENGDLARVTFHAEGDSVANFDFEPCGRIQLEEVGAAKSLAVDVVSALLDGDEDSARSSMRSLIRTVESKAAVSEEEATQGILAVFEADRPWRRWYSENEDKVHSELGPKLGAVYSSRVEPKFQELMDGLNEDESVKKELISLELKELADRFDFVQFAVSEHISKVRSSVVAQSRDDELSSLFEFLSLELKLETGRIAKALSQVDAVRLVSSLASIHDRGAQALYRLELVEKYVGHLATKIREAEK